MEIPWRERARMPGDKIKLSSREGMKYSAGSALVLLLATSSVVAADDKADVTAAMNAWKAGLAAACSSDGPAKILPLYAEDGVLGADFKAIADFGGDNGAALCAACAQFIVSEAIAGLPGLARCCGPGGESQPGRQLLAPA